jgi:hypothetical protein
MKAIELAYQLNPALPDANLDFKVIFIKQDWIIQLIMSMPNMVSKL